MEKISLKLSDIEYIQSANTLFNFMPEEKYLNDIIENRAIIPRYCLENVEYLNIISNGRKITEIAVLQKCFCDIPFHKFTDNIVIKGVGDVFNNLTSEEKNKIISNQNHTTIYGKYGIAFSKKWCEDRNFLPIHYINLKSDYTRNFSDLLNEILGTDNIPNMYGFDIIYRLSYIKPLYGIMSRELSLNNSNKIKINIQKNFHDECEWRFIPNFTNAKNLNLNTIIANPNVIELKNFIFDINETLKSEQFHRLWLTFNYDDIRYIIVPDIQARLRLINKISSFPIEYFKNEAERLTLYSKILVLEEIRKDW